MKKPSPNEQLDTVLDIIVKSNFPLTQKEIAAKIILIDSDLYYKYYQDDLSLILTQLIDDRFAKQTNKNETNEVAFTKTFVGKYFVGYLEKADCDVRTERRKDRNEWLMIVGTFLAGIGALSLTWWEYLKYTSCGCN